MKKINILLFFVAAIFASCNDNDSSEKGQNDSSEDTVKQELTKEEPAANNINFSGAEIAYVKNEKLYFYYPETEEHKQFAQEKEPVFNCVFDNTSDIIYYTVVRDGTLRLKKASYDKTPVQITEIGNTKVKKEKCITDTYGEKSILLFTRGASVVLPHDFLWDCFCFQKAAVYPTTVGDVGDNSIQNTKLDYKDIKYFNKFMDRAAVEDCKTAKSKLIYKNKNLSNTLGLKVGEYMKELGETEIVFSDFKFSADKSKLIFGAMTDMGDLAHGPYCMANTDGSHQQILTEEGLSSDFKPFWLGNRAVFWRQIKEENSSYQELYITDPADNSSSPIVKDLDYYTVREIIK